MKGKFVKIQKNLMARADINGPMEQPIKGHGSMEPCMGKDMKCIRIVIPMKDST